MALSNYIPSSQTVSAIRTGNANAIAQAWSPLAILEANEEDDLSLLEGAEGSDRPIHEKTDLKKGMGDRVWFNTFGELGSSGKRGSAVLSGNTENPPEGSFYVDIDLIRNGVSHKQLVEQMTNVGASRTEIETQLLGRWHGRKNKMDKLQRWIKSATADNTLRPDGKTRDQLLSTHTFGTRLSEDVQSLLITRNGAPTNVGKADSGAEIYGYLFYSVNDVLRTLRQEDDWLKAQQYAGVRGEGNSLFNGELRQWNNNVFWNSNTPDKPTRGPLGSAMAPKAWLGDANVVSGGATCLSGSTVDFSTGNGTIYLYGSGISQTDLGDYAGAFYYPFEHFPGFDYKWTEKQGSSPDGSTRYGIIYDPSDRKWMTFEYTGSGNIGYRITIGTRLAAASSSSRSTTHLGFTYDSTVNKEAFPISSWIFPCNAKGVVFGYVLALGKGSLYSAYGKSKMERVMQEQDFGEDKGIGIRTIAGCNVPVNAFSKITGYVLTEVAYTPAGCTGLPQVTV